MTVGLLAHLLGTLPYRQLAEKAAEQGMDYVQLALSKAISDVDFSLGRLSPGLANEIGGAFAEHRVGIAVLGCYASLIELDDERFRHNVDRFKEHLRHARHFGAPIVATEVGVPADPARHDVYEERLNRALEELVGGSGALGSHDRVGSGARPLDRLGGCAGRDVGKIPHPPASASCSIRAQFAACRYVWRSGRSDARRFPPARAAYRERACEGFEAGENGEVTGTAAGLGDLNYPLFWQLLERHKPRGFVTLEDVQGNNWQQPPVSFAKAGRQLYG